MSDIDHEDHEEIARRLRDDGQAQAPPDLADEVMKRVRSEPRRSTSAVRRPLMTLLAASLLTVALVGGIAKLGGGGSGSAAGGFSGGGGGSEANAPATSDGKPGQARIVESKRLADVPRSALSHLAASGSITLDSVAGNDAGYCRPDVFFKAGGPFAVAVPYSAWDSVQAQLHSAKMAQPDSSSSRVNVQLHRLARGAAWPPAVTCP
jgi:hypothetical protein